MIIGFNRGEATLDGEKIDDGEIDKITAEIEAQTKNIILVGMPGC